LKKDTFVPNDGVEFSLESLLPDIIPCRGATEFAISAEFPNSLVGDALLNVKFCG